jgi:hypothetical protein
MSNNRLEKIAVGIIATQIANNNLKGIDPSVASSETSPLLNTNELNCILETIASERKAKEQAVELLKEVEDALTYGRPIRDAITDFLSKHSTK